MKAQAVLERASDLGISLRVEDGHIIYSPKSSAPPGFVSDLRQVKAEIIERLADNPESALPAGCRRLLARLREARLRLKVEQERLAATDEVNTPAEDSYFADREEWHHLDNMLRFVYPQYQACIMGSDQRCPDENPVTCQWCASRRISDGR